MKLKYFVITALISVVTAFNGISQENKYVNVITQPIDIYDWPEESSVTQTKLWPGGKTRLEYIDQGSGTKLRKEYDELGNLWQSIEVRQIFRVDTITIFNEETYLETITIKKAFYDVPFGEFVEYDIENVVNPKNILARGRYKNGEKSGEWVIYKEDGSIMKTVSFGEK